MANRASGAAGGAAEAGGSAGFFRDVPSAVVAFRPSRAPAAAIVPIAFRLVVIDAVVVDALVAEPVIGEPAPSFGCTFVSSSMRRRVLIRCGAACQAMRVKAPRFCGMQG